MNNHKPANGKKPAKTSKTAMGESAPALKCEPALWSFLDGVSWKELAPEDSGSGVRRLTLFPVSKKFRTEALKSWLEEEIASLQEFVQKIFAGVDPKQYVRIDEVPILVFPGQKLFVEDCAQIHLTIHDSYRYWGHGYNLPNSAMPESQLDDFLKNSQSLRPLRNIAGIPRDAWRFCKEAEARAIFRGGSPGGWGRTEKIPDGVTLYSDSGRPANYYLLRANAVKPFDNSDHHNVADIYVAPIPDGCILLEFLLQQHWTPKTAVNTPQWKQLADLYERKLVRIIMEGSGIRLLPTEKLFQAMQQGTVPLMGDNPVVLGSEKLLQDAKAAVLSCDNRRANISPYDPMQLEDPNRGSWELWDPPMDGGAAAMVIPGSVYARDPRLDIQEGGVIGIDFGTKSTVVARQDDSSRSILVRIGQGAYEQAVKKDDYENPTVMQFINLQRFLDAYQSRKGRPATLWEDLTVSHTAFEKWMNNTCSRLYFSFFDDLKQWAGSRDRHVRLRDEKGTIELDLRPYLELKQDDFDPIELYAYYIGLYINNMYTGRIYLEYLLSFPVTYSQAVRRKILDSFRRGLAKSLPESVLNDPECAEQFSVEQGAGEPAAYAVCALQEYGFCPDEGENVYYAVFDFGGGTTDFDFGLWRRATKEKSEKNYRYVISHFGDGGDQYMGGENLLELLAYHVFRNNLDLLRQSGIPFSLPPQQELFDGHEYVISDSQEAHTNMRRMMEALRPLWEHREGYESKYADGVLQVELVNRDGQAVNGVQIHVDPDKLETILRRRIAEGVEKFFNALRTVFTQELFGSKDANCIHIFLAGNASKSDILQAVFLEKIRSFTEDILREYEGMGEEIPEDWEFFKLYDPLGTDGAKKIMRERGCGADGEEEENADQARRPTGKTGVAFGLIQCRSGSKIKVLNETRADAEIKFLYWLGDDVDDYFDPFLTRSTEYGKWVEYRNAETKHFEFYYTTDPSAERPNVLPIVKAQKWRSKPIPQSAINEDWLIFLRAKGPNLLEYVIAEDQAAADQGRYQYGPVEITLGK